MAKIYKIPNDGQYQSFGHSDFLNQVAWQVAHRPDSCLTKNLLSWYSSLYSELSTIDSCAYQVEINQELCEAQAPTDIESMVEIFQGFLSGRSDRVARALIGIVCRQVRREQRLANSPSVLE